MEHIILPCPAGLFLDLCAEDGAVCALSLRPGLSPLPCPGSFAESAAREVLEYLAASRSVFTFPLSLHTTPFRESVYRALLSIPYGETRSYAAVASAIGRPSAVRAVASACACNPVWLAVPCHRVIGSDGSLRGYAGGLPLKGALLRMEAGGGPVLY